MRPAKWSRSSGGTLPVMCECPWRYIANTKITPSLHWRCWLHHGHVLASWILHVLRYRVSDLYYEYLKPHYFSNALLESNSPRHSHEYWEIPRVYTSRHKRSLRQKEQCFRRVCKVAKAAISFVMSVCASVCLSCCMGQIGSHWTDFSWHLVLHNIFVNTWGKLKVN
jgi:hypothetical protein